MAIEIIMPQMGESIAEGTITKWYKKVGDEVERDEPLFEISTDKVDTEIPSPGSGVLTEIKVGEGETVPINTVVAVLGGEKAQEAPPEAPAVEAAKAAEAAETPVPEPAADVPEWTAEEAAAAAAEAPDVDGEREVRSSPLVRRMAREHDVDLTRIAGSGREGRITKGDILSFIEKGARVSAPAVPAAPPRIVSGDAAVQEEKVPMSIMRKSIAEHMVVSRRTSAHVTTVFEADVSRIVKIREEHKDRFVEKEGMSLTFMSFFIRAAVGGLKAFPVVNASIEGDKIVYRKEINIGVAVALDWGLIVPVIHHADEKSFLGLNRAVADLAERARHKKLLPEEVQGGTFTITNPGPYGALFGTPIINQPQVAILGLGGIHKRPIVVNDAIAIRSMVYLALSFDHRLIDGAVADQFMAEVKRRLENWAEKIL